MCSASFLISTNALQVTTPTNRQKALLMFINLVRWARTVHDQHVLPMHKHQLFRNMPRASPYPGEFDLSCNVTCCGVAAPHAMHPSRMSCLAPSCYRMGSLKKNHVTSTTLLFWFADLIDYHHPNQVTLKLNHVTKSIAAPFSHLETLVKTYRMLASEAIPGACQVDKLEVRCLSSQAWCSLCHPASCVLIGCDQQTNHHPLQYASCRICKCHKHASALIHYHQKHASATDMVFMQVHWAVVDLLARRYKLPVAPRDLGLITLTVRPVGMHQHIAHSNQLLGLIKQLLATLTALHKQNWVHRDVRMDNLVHGPQGGSLLTVSLLHQLDSLFLE